MDLLPYQRRAVQFIEQWHGCVALFMDRGTGKTPTTLAYLRKHRLFPCLLVCRRDDFLTWETHAEDFGVAVCRVTGSKAIPADPGASDLTMVTYDLMRSGSVRNFIRGFPWKAVVADESQQVRHWKAKRTKALYRATRHVDKRLALTGSPMDEPTDLWAQLYFVDNGETLGKNFWQFREQYYWCEPNGFTWHLKGWAKTAIRKRLASRAFIVDKDDVLDLPRARYLIKGAPMSGGQRRLYREMRNNFQATLRDRKEALEVTYVTTQLTKLQQIASGFIYDDDHVPHYLACGKLDLLMRLITDPEEYGNKPKIVIWTAFTASIERIARRARAKSIPTLTYGGTDEEKREVRRLFGMRRSKWRLFIAGMDRGVGMNELVVADTAFYYGRSNKLISLGQSRDRTRRFGSERHDRITYIDLVTEHSIDEKQIRALRRKQSLARQIIRSVRAGKEIDHLL